jgi:hypothetical protein
VSEIGFNQNLIRRFRDITPRRGRVEIGSTANSSARGRRSRMKFGGRTGPCWRQSVVVHTGRRPKTAKSRFLPVGYRKMFLKIHHKFHRNVDSAISYFLTPGTRARETYYSGLWGNIFRREYLKNVSINIDASCSVARGHRDLATSQNSDKFIIRTRSY